MRRNKVDEKIWYDEVEKYKSACKQLEKTITCTMLKYGFMGLKCWTWYPENAPDDLNISTFSDFLKYLGEEVYYRERPTKEQVCEYAIKLREQLGRNIKLSDFENNKQVKKSDILYYFGSFNKMNKELGFEETGTYRGHSYSKEELIEAVKNFVSENGFIPSAKFIDTHGKEYGMPNRKTYNNKFGSWKNVLRECGFDEKEYAKNYILNENGDYVLKHDNAEFLQNIIFEYIEKYNKIPGIRDINKYYGTDLKNYFKKYFGGYNNCLESLGLKINQKSEYKESELDKAFMDFVNEYDRVPTIQDFNKTGRPSFWVYQQRFGSWAETCIHYGFKPNCRRPEFYMDDGERCDSSCEYDISTWLKSKGIKYDRDIPYVDFTTNYKGKMNCDYRFTLADGTVWYVEMAGFINTYDFSKLTSREEQIYFFKIKYKEKLFRENHLNYKIIKRDDLRTKTMEEIFDFLNIENVA